MKRMQLVISFLSYLLLVQTPLIFASDYTGMWWDPASEGTGVFIEHDETQNCICGAWYLYDESGSPLWTTFWGTISNGKLTSNLYSFTGPAFGTSWDVSQIKSAVAGTVTFDFLSDSAITMTFEVHGVSGQLNLSRFSMTECPGWLWWDPEKPGQGVVLFPLEETGQEAKIAFVWYIYDTSGNPVWYTALGPATEKNNLPAYLFSGPPLGQAWDISLVRSQTAGTINVENMQPAVFQDQQLIMPHNSLTYNIHGISGELNLEPFWCSSLCN